ncbi:MAG: hypothetical protein CMD27_00320 [Flavobacteriales bacterium]|nr:hypothetical protein [Flavobacteriales bacterium]
MKKFILIIFYMPLFTYSQSNQIYIDGYFEDWVNINNYADPNDNIESGVDFINISVTNDDKYLYIKFETNEEIDLSDGNYDIELLLDTDNNNITGWSPGFNDNIGAEIGIMFNQRFFWYNVPETDLQLSLYDMDIYPAPTVTSNQFEIAIALDSEYEEQLLFPNSEIKIQLTDWVSNDKIPNNNSEIIYTIQSNNQSYSQIQIPKTNNDLIRLTAYNVLNNGFNNEERMEGLKNILQSLNSDIFAFSECGNTTTQSIKNILDEILNLNTELGWFVVKKDGDDLIIASKFPISAHWPSEDSGIKKMHPCLIDLPDNLYAQDLLVVNAHMSCCGSDSLRQIQADDFVNFILDAKSEGGIIDLAESTPFVLCGDLNLVGYSQQLTTLITGEIINTSLFGQGGGMNWADNNLKDQVCWNTEQPLSYTWRDISPNEGIPGSYPHGRLDFIIFSDDVMYAEKSFSIDTELMSQQILNTNNLFIDDSKASDHLAITTDFSLPNLLSNHPNKLEKKKINHFDILGKDSNHRNFIIEIYDNGEIEKKYFIK